MISLAGFFLSTWINFIPRLCKSIVEEDEITYPLANLTDEATEVCEWISILMGHMLTHPCWDSRYNVFRNEALRNIYAAWEETEIIIPDIFPDKHL